MTGPVVFDPMTLPSDDNVNAYTFCVELKGSQWFLQKGKMIAYYGRIDFNGIGHGRLDRLLRTTSLQHGGHPVLRWMASVVEVIADGNDNIRTVKPNRNKSQARIDGVQASVMGLSGYLRRPKKKSRIAVGF